MMAMGERDGETSNEKCLNVSAGRVALGVHVRFYLDCCLVGIF